MLFRVKGSPEFDAYFQELRVRADQGNHESLEMVKLIERGIEKLKFDYHYGDHLSQSKIPKEYRERFGIENLWKLNLNSFWRMIYTVRGTEVEVMSILLEVLDHKAYDRKFDYKTS